MIISIMEAISIALNAEFGEEYEIFIEEINQDLSGNNFFIQCLNPANDLFLGKRYFNSNQFCIQYFPLSQDGRNRECYEVLERMNQCLVYITMGDGLMRGTQMNGKIVDGVLNFFVNYDCFVYKWEAETAGISEMTSSITVKEGD